MVVHLRPWSAEPRQVVSGYSDLKGAPVPVPVRTHAHNDASHLSSAPLDTGELPKHARAQASIPAQVGDRQCEYKRAAAGTRELASGCPAVQATCKSCREQRAERNVQRGVGLQARQRTGGRAGAGRSLGVK